MIRAEGESDDEIVDAQRPTNEHEMPNGEFLFLDAVSLSEEFGHDGVRPGETEQRTCDRLGGAAQAMGEGATNQETDDRHDAFENPEDHRDSKAQFSIDAGDSEGR